MTSCRQTDATAAGRAKYGHQTISSNDTIQVKIQSYQRFQIESTQKAGGQKKMFIFFCRFWLDQKQQPEAKQMSGREKGCLHSSKRTREIERRAEQKNLRKNNIMWRLSMCELMLWALS